jgi:hypothetical protein
MPTQSAEWSALLGRMRKPVVPAEEPEPELKESLATEEPVQEGSERAAHDLSALQEELSCDETLILRMLGMLYLTKKRSVINVAVSIFEVEKQMGLPREGATFVCEYMKKKNLVVADDKSRFTITVEGIDYLRQALGVQRTHD